MSIAEGIKGKRRKPLVRLHREANFLKAVNFFFDNPNASTAEYLTTRANKLKEVRR